MGRKFVIVLDTHAWVWWVGKPEKLGKKALRALNKADRIGVPAISIWEIAMKVQAKKLKFNRPCDLWVDEALAQDERVEVLHLPPRIALNAAELSWDHADPVDRMIVATARAHEALLITADERIHTSRLVTCCWD